MVTTPQKVTAFYDFKPPKESGQKPDSVIADIFILTSSAESAKMIDALRRKTKSIKGNILRDAPNLSRGAFVSHYAPEAHYGDRVTFSDGNLVITLSPSHNGLIVAGKFLETLRKQ